MSSRVSLAAALMVRRCRRRGPRTASGGSGAARWRRRCRRWPGGSRPPPGGVLLLDGLLQPLDDLLLQGLVLGPVAPHAVDAGALVGELDRGAGELHEVAA